MPFAWLEKKTLGDDGASDRRSTASAYSTP
jgi:hypothetical protein